MAEIFFKCYYSKKINRSRKIPAHIIPPSFLVHEGVILVYINPLLLHCGNLFKYFSPSIYLPFQ
jgi:hypothetical protein